MPLEFKQGVRDLLKTRNEMKCLQAHSISEWGGEFRPCYREISFFREDFPEVPIMALGLSAEVLPDLPAIIFC